MRIDVWYSIGIIAIVALGTFFTRAFPFLLFGSKQPPKIVLYIGKYLPGAVIAILVVYCIGGSDISLAGVNMAAVVPKLIAGAFVVLLHVWKRNNLLSIGGGTLLYMLLIQHVFVTV